MAGCASSTQSALSGGTEVTVGGKQFTEQLILSNMSALMLEDAGVSVDDAYPVGGNTANHEAITSGETTHYWEYTGTGWNFHLGNTEEKIRDPDELYESVDQAYVETLSDLAEHINDGGEVTWAVSQEYLNNPTAFGNLPEFYGFEENMDNVTYERMAIGTINYRATAEGEVDLGVGFATNPNLQKFDLATIDDDQNWFVIYYPAPVVDQDALNDTVREALNAPASALDTETMIELNARVSIDEESPETVAQDWLESEGML
jgi:osmoprotectant transport system substrate-binding protein